MPIDERWRVYPYQAAAGDAELIFPAAEAYQGGATDTYYVSGVLDGVQSGRRFAFLAIFVKIARVARLLAADFHIVALFDLDGGGYTTAAAYDLPPWRYAARRRLSVARGELDVTWRSPAWQSRLQAQHAAGGRRIPFAYTLDCRGRDGSGAPVALTLSAEGTKPPQPVGGPQHGGRITVMGQPGTYSYYQSLRFAGHLRWRSADEPVRGEVGWLDRQWFPRYVGADAGLLAERYGHQWCQLSLDNGWELSLWRHFARAERNREVPFSGVTISDPAGRTTFSAEYQVDVLSYCRDRDAVVPLMTPVQRACGVHGPARYFFDAFRLRVPALDLDVTSTPLVAAPAHRMPVAYLSGPTRLAGTMSGRPVAGYGFNERTLPLSRPWELLDVLRDTLRDLPPAAQRRAEPLVDALAPLVDTRRAREARALVAAELRPALAEHATPLLRQICDDLAAALRGR